MGQRLITFGWVIKILSDQFWSEESSFTSHISFLACIMDSKKVKKKLLAVGSIGSGTTELLFIFKTGRTDWTYMPTVFANHVVDVKVDFNEFELDLWDFTPIYPRIRNQQYPDTKVVLMCFSTKFRDSFEDVAERWVPEVKFYCPNIPILLVGNHTKRIEDDFCDVVISEIKTEVGTEEGRELARKIGAVDYMECCAKNNEGVKEVFQAAARLAWYGEEKTLARSKKKRRCIVQ